LVEFVLILILIAEIFVTGGATEQAASEGELAVMTDKLSQFWEGANNSDKTMLTL
jgi:hypothetical protein